MKKYNKSLMLLVVMVFMTLSASSASAYGLKITGGNGSVKVMTNHYKAKSRVPIMGTLKMPHSFIAGVPTRAELTLKFWNAPLPVRIHGKAKRIKAFKLFNRAQVYPGGKWFTWSCRPPEGTPPADFYQGMCDESKFQTGLRDGTELPERGTKWEKLSYDIAQPNFDTTYTSIPLRSKWLKKNQSVKYKLWVTFPRCLPLDQVQAPYIPAPAGVAWPCEPGSLRIGTTFKLRGNKGWVGDGDMAFFSNRAMYIYPPANQNVAPTPTGATGPTS